MNARVRSPGASVAETASAAARRCVAVGRLQAAERDLERQLLAVERDPQRGDLLAEQPAPGALAGDRLLGQDLLLGLGQQVRAVAAGAAQVVGAELSESSASSSSARSSGSAAHSSSKNSSLVSISVARSWTQLQQRAALGVGGVGREPQRRVRAGAADQLVDRGELVHRLGELGAIELGDLAGVRGGERGRALAASSSWRCTPVVALAVDQRAEIPLGLEQFGIGEQFGRRLPSPDRLAALGAQPRLATRATQRLGCPTRGAGAQIRRPPGAAAGRRRHDRDERRAGRAGARRRPAARGAAAAGGGARSCEPRTCCRCPGRRSRSRRRSALAQPRLRRRATTATGS